MTPVTKIFTWRQHSLPPALRQKTSFDNAALVSYFRPVSDRESKDNKPLAVALAAALCVLTGCSYALSPIDFLLPGVGGIGKGLLLKNEPHQSPDPNAVPPTIGQSAPPQDKPETEIVQLDSK